ncbi:hypothetical protein LJR016_004338 [Devosia sp. LjRoot16]|uniref:hypothetical protein n=1 Tax=Devosia sp. LjRoot16 TaxID=3342271 RepID=UPI003ED1350E
MRRPKVPHKPPAPSVREIVGAALDRSRALSGEHPMTQQEVVKDMIAKLDLPASLKARLKERHKLD